MNFMRIIIGPILIIYNLKTIIYVFTVSQMIIVELYI